MTSPIAEFLILDHNGSHDRSISIYCRREQNRSRVESAGIVFQKLKTRNNKNVRRETDTRREGVKGESREFAKADKTWCLHRNCCWALEFSLACWRYRGLCCSTLRGYIYTWYGKNDIHSDIFLEKDISENWYFYICSEEYIRIYWLGFFNNVSKNINTYMAGIFLFF